MSQPLLSVVIANYNYGRFLEDAILSVLSQSCKDFELIIVDGGSSDNSVQIIKKYQDRITWWVSEEDKGQSDAFNKGFAKATGRFLTWLNADDILMPETVMVLANCVKTHPDCEWYTGNLLQFRQDTKKIVFAPWGPHVLPPILQTYNSPLVIFGPTTFWSARSYKAVGPIDVDLHYSMDTDYWLRMKKAGYRQHRLNHCCWAFRMHNTSKTAQYDGREIDKNIKNKWYEELELIMGKHNYKCSFFRRMLAFGLRVIDGSALVALYRRVFVVGSKFKY